MDPNWRPAEHVFFGGASQRLGKYPSQPLALLVTHFMGYISLPLLKDIFIPLLVLKGKYHYWKYVFFLQGS